jgi:hypothetical protein
MSEDWHAELERPIIKNPVSLGGFSLLGEIESGGREKAND